MNYFSMGKPKIVRKVFSALAIGALVIGGFSSLASTSRVYADAGFSASIVPNSGTLMPDQSADIYFQDSSPSNDFALAGACTVNGVDVSGTYQSLTDGLYRVIYTASSTDPSRAAGQIPLNCTLSNGSTTVAFTQFADGNTLAIEAATTTPPGDTGGGTGTTTPPTGGDTGGGTGTTTPPATGLSMNFAGIVPTSGTISAGITTDVYFTAANDETDVMLGGACRVNNIDVSATFQNLSGGLYRVNYTVGSGDAERQAGHIPVSCAFQNPAGDTTTVSAFTDGNTLAIDANNDGLVTEPTNNNGVAFMSTVTADPNTGTLGIGDHLDVLMQEGNHQNDFTAGTCTVNGVNVAGTFANLTDGLYRVRYTVGAGDTSRAAGQIPVDCTLHNSTGQTISTFFGFTDSNTAAISVASGGGTGGTGTTTPPTATTTTSFFTSVSAVPNTGALDTGNTMDVYFQAPATMNDITLGGACTVNGVNVAGTFQNLTDGLYRVNYTVGSTDTARAAGQIPIRCLFQNSANATTSVTAFTDSNTLAISPTTGGDTGGGTGTTTPPTGGDTGGSTGGNLNGTTTSPITISWVTPTPDSGTLHQGAHILAYFQEAHNMTDLAIDGACRINNVNIGLENLNLGLYRLDYTIGLHDTDRAAGTVPIFCALRNSAGATTSISSWTGSNTVAVDAADDGIGTSSAGGSVGGDVVGGSDAPLGVTSIDQVSGTATAGAGYEHGWVWVLHVTVPSNETSLSAKFSDWTHSNGTTRIPAGGNMRISSPQANTSTAVDITAANTYSAPLILTGDMDSSAPGRQIEIRVEMKIPQSTLNGSYTTDYGIKSS
ncbi:hypothetical protein KW799_00475 [Candidatus Parcubacteria bacterium]|nr:hypothetical protein [Candidatus Parcubacteria bacterium]